MYNVIDARYGQFSKLRLPQGADSLNIFLQHLIFVIYVKYINQLKMIMYCISHTLTFVSLNVASLAHGNFSPR